MGRRPDNVGFEAIRDWRNIAGGSDDGADIWRHVSKRRHRLGAAMVLNEITSMLASGRI